MGDKRKKDFSFPICHPMSPHHRARLSRSNSRNGSRNRIQEDDPITTTETVIEIVDVKLEKKDDKKEEGGARTIDLDGLDGLLKKAKDKETKLEHYGKNAKHETGTQANDETGLGKKDDKETVTGDEEDDEDDSEDDDEDDEDDDEPTKVGNEKQRRLSRRASKAQEKLIKLTRNIKNRKISSKIKKGKDDDENKKVDTGDRGNKDQKDDMEEKGKKGKALFFNSPRTVIRLSLFAFIFATVVSYFGVMDTINSCNNKNLYMYAMPNNLDIQLKNCQLEFQRVDKFKNESSKLKYEMQYYGAISNTLTESIIRTFSISTHYYYCPCKIVVKYKKGLSLPPMNIDISGIDDTPIYNNFAQNITFTEFNLSAVNSNVRFQNAIFEEAVNIKISNLGSVVMWDTYMNKNTNIQAAFGDISFNLKNQDVIVKQSKGHFAGTCIAANNVTELGMSDCVNVTINANETNEICKYETRRLRDTDENILKNQEFENGNNLPIQLTVETKYGGIYVKLQSTLPVLIANDGSLASLNTTNYTTNNTNTLPFSPTVVDEIDYTWIDPVALVQINNMKKTREEKESQDIFVKLDLRTSIGSPGHFIFTNNPVYLVVSPWVLSSFTLGLVQPILFDIKLKLPPIKCPHDSFIYNGINKYGQVAKLIENAIKEKPTDYVARRYISFSSDGPGIGHNTDVKTTVVTYVEGYGGQYNMTEHSIWNKYTVLLTFFISFVLAGLFGVGTTIVVYTSFVNVIESLFKELDSKERLEQLKREVRKPKYFEPNYKNDAIQRLSEDKKKQAESDDKPSEDGNDEGDDGDDNDELNRKRQAYLFMLPEFINDMYRRGKTNSLEAFLKYKSVPAKPKATTGRVDVTKFNELYEKFCFDNGFKMKKLTTTESKKFLEKHGVVSKTVFDVSCDVYSGIRFASRREQAQREGMSLLPNESSLQFYVRNQCTVTPFPDNIRVRLFNRRYEEFCSTKAAGAPVPVTKRGMRSLGVEFERLHVATFEFKNFLDDGEQKTIKLDFERDFTNLEVSWLMESLSTILNLFMIILCAAPLLGICLYAEEEFNRFSLLPNSRRFSRRSIRSMYLTMHYVELQNIIVQSYQFVLVTFMLIELVWYMLTIKKDVDTQSKYLMSGTRKQLNNIICYMSLINLAMICSFFSLLSVWLVLAAVLNPTLYLPLAASAGTMMTVGGAKAAGYVKMFNKETDKILKLVQWVLVEKQHDTILKLEKYDIQADSSVSVDPMLADVINVIRADETLVSYIDKLKISVKNTISLIKGQERIRKETAAKLGMNKHVLEAVVASGVKKYLPMPIEKICDSKGVQIESRTARVLYNLAKPNTDESLRLATKEAVTLFSTLNDISVSPHKVESIISISRGNIGRFVDILVETADEKLKSVSKFFEALRNKNISKMNQEFLEDMSAIGTDLCHIPKDVMKGIEDLASGKLLSKDLDQLAKRLGIDLGLLKIIAASSNEDGDFMRKYGPGSKSFQAISKTFPGFKNIECIRRKTKKQTKKTGLKIINVDLKKEIIEIKNFDSSTCNLKNFKIKDNPQLNEDGDANEFKFPDTATINGFQNIKIYCAVAAQQKEQLQALKEKEENDKNVFLWRVGEIVRDVGVLNDSGDTIMLLDAEGKEVSTFFGTPCKCPTCARKLLAVMNLCCWGATINVDRVAKRYGVDSLLTKTIAHLISQEYGKGQPKLGLIAEDDYSHLSIASNNLRLKDPSSLLGLIEIISGGSCGWTPQYVRAAIHEIGMRLALTETCEDFIYFFLQFLTSTKSCSRSRPCPSCKEKNKKNGNGTSCTDDFFCDDSVEYAGRKCKIREGIIQICLLSAGLKAPSEVFNLKLDAEEPGQVSKKSDGPKTFSNVASEIGLDSKYSPHSRQEEKERKRVERSIIGNLKNDKWLESLKKKAMNEAKEEKEEETDDKTSSSVNAEAFKGSTISQIANAKIVTKNLKEVSTFNPLKYDNRSSSNASKFYMLRFTATTSSDKLTERRCMVRLFE